jgi:hypothetical protein
MQKSTQRRVFGIAAVVLATQVLSACVVVPVPHRHRAVVVQPGYLGPPPVHHHRHHHHQRDYRR